MREYGEELLYDMKHTPGAVERLRCEVAQAHNVPTTDRIRDTVVAEVN